MKTSCEDWELDDRYTNVYIKTRKFGSYYYRLHLIPHNNQLWVSLSSGKKRNQLDNFEPDGIKRDNGILPLLWVRDEILQLPESFSKSKYNNYTHICIGWSDSQRRDVYRRLTNYGFRISRDKGVLILIKDI